VSNGDGGWWRVVVVCLSRSGGGHGRCVRKRERGEGVEGRKPETKLLRLGSGSAMSNGDGGWWRVVVVCLSRSGGGHGLCVRKRERGEGVEGRKPETKPLRLGSGSAVSNGDGVWHRVVVVCLSRSGGGGGHRVG
jgi:hypothetical protein